MVSVAVPNIEMQVDNDPSVDLEELQALSLSASLNSTKYSFMNMFIARVLNLSNESEILDPSSYHKRQHKPPVEILPQIAVPGDLWLADDIGIKDVKLKNVLLRDFNSMLASCVSSLEQNNYLLLEESLLENFKHQIFENDFQAFLLQPKSPFDSTDESASENSTDFFTSAKSPVEDPNSQSSPSTARPSSFSSNRNTMRMASFSRDSISGMRKLSFLSQTSSTKVNSPISQHDDRSSMISAQTPPQTPTIAPPTMQVQASQKTTQAHGSFFKYKLYNKIKGKRRDHLSSNVGSGNGNSSAVPSLRNPLVGDLPDMSSNARKNSQSAVAQRIENQKTKYEYYFQVRVLSENISQLVSHIGRTGSQSNLMTLLEFIKNNVFKFIIVDVCHMIIAKGLNKMVRI